MSKGVLATMNRVYAGRRATPPTEADLTVGGAELLRSNNYAIVPTDPATRRPFGAFSTFQPSISSDRRELPCSCLCVCPPPYGCGAPYENVERLRVAALVVDVRRHPAVSAEIQEVIAQRAAWPTASRVQPLRVAEDGSLLRVYQLRGDRFQGPRSLGYSLPGDKPYGEPHTVRVLCAGEFFTVSGPLAERPEVAYSWRPGLDAAHRDELPLLDHAAASALVNACEDVLARYGRR